MKLAAKMNPKNIFRTKKHKKDNTVSRSESSSFSSSLTGGTTTPTTVLPQQSLYEELTQAFKLIDTDNDGRITRTDLESLLCKMGPISPTELCSMVNEVDRNGDGNINLSEFKTISPEVFGEEEALSDEELRGAFEFFDGDGDGMITEHELYEVFNVIGNGCTLEECRRMIKNVDMNNDGFVCFDDFKVMMENQQV